MKHTATMEGGSASWDFLQIWLHDPELLRLEFSEVIGA
jgi:hypothetical protein